MFRLLIFIVIFIATNSAEEKIKPPLFRHYVEDVPHIRPVNDQSYLLPKTSKPINYNIELSTQIDEKIFMFQGRVEIEIEILEFTSNIVLHSFNLTIEDTKLTKNDRLTPVELLGDHKYDGLRNFLIIETVDEALIPGEIYFLTIRYNGELRDDEAGFYRSSYSDDNGDTV